MRYNALFIPSFIAKHVQIISLVCLYVLQIIWRPYETEDVRQLIPDYCLAGREVWLAQVPLICFHIIEWHHPDRVLRQFAIQQPIPDEPVNLGPLHTLDLSGKTGTNWLHEHIMYVEMWMGWVDRVVHGVRSTARLTRNSEYMKWYWRHTRRWIHPTTGSSGYVVCQ